MAACIDSLLSEAIARFSELSLRTVNLKTEQKRAVKSLLSGRDVLAVLPTGYGKSMIFQVFAVAKAISTKDPGTVQHEFVWLPCLQYCVCLAKGLEFSVHSPVYCLQQLWLCIYMTYECICGCFPVLQC